MITPGIDKVLKLYLELMDVYDSQHLVGAFENVVSIFTSHLKPYAVDICNHLKIYYTRCVELDNQEDGGVSFLTSVALFNAMRRVLDVVKDDVELLLTIEKILYPCL